MILKTKNSNFTFLNIIRVVTLFFTILISSTLIGCTTNGSLNSAESQTTSLNEETIDLILNEDASRFLNILKINNDNFTNYLQYDNFFYITLDLISSENACNDLSKRYFNVTNENVQFSIYEPNIFFKGDYQIVFYNSTNELTKINNIYYYKFSSFDLFQKNQSRKYITYDSINNLTETKKNVFAFKYANTTTSKYNYKFNNFLFMQSCSTKKDFYFDLELTRTGGQKEFIAPSLLIEISPYKNNNLSFTIDTLYLENNVVFRYKFSLFNFGYYVFSFYEEDALLPFSYMEIEFEMLYC